MVIHYIILSSSYSKGKRIALDFPIEEGKDVSNIQLENIVHEITNKCGNDVSMSTHIIRTDSKLWSSVVKKDFFFKNVEVVHSTYRFIQTIQRDREITGIDVAKYILSKIKCTHLKLEKLTYFCYADYYCRYQRRLFQDEIYAYKYGPVVKSVYDTFKRYGYKEIDEKNIDNKNFDEMPARSRILFAIDGMTKMKSIDDTLNIYGQCSASELVAITHRDKTPWSLSGKGLKKDELIQDEKILLYHANEKVEK